MNEELLQKAVMMQQESQETERKLELIEEQLRELDEFSKGLELFEKSKEKEMLASFGKGVYVKSEIKDEKLFVNVGVGVVVRKSAAETKEIIQEQMKRFAQARIQLTAQLEEYSEELGRMIREIEKLRKKN